MLPALFKSEKVSCFMVWFYEWMNPQVTPLRRRERSMQSKVCVNADGRRQGGSLLQAIVGRNIGKVFRL